MPTLSTLNDRAVSWAEITIAFNIPGVAILKGVDIKSIEHESKVDVGDQRGATGGRVVKRTTGQLTTTGGATFYTEGLAALEEALATAAEAAGYFNGNGSIQLSKVRFDILVAHDWVDDPAFYRRELIGCRLLRTAEKDEESADARTVDVDLNPISIVKVLPSGRRVELL